MKKVIGIILVLTMALSLSACGGSDLIDTGKSFSIGTVNGNVYTNEYVGFEFNPSGNWTYYTAEQIAQINQLVLDSVDSDLSQKLENTDVVQAMYTSNENGGNVNINYEKLEESYLKNAVVSEIYESALPDLEKAYKDMGTSMINYEISEITVDGKTLDCFKSSVDLGSDMKMYQTAFALKTKNHLVNVTCSAFSEEELQNILDSFKWID